MPLTLSTELPEGFWTHNSGGEHVTKHYADIGEVRAVRAHRGEPDVGEDDMLDLMREDGLVVVRPSLEGGGAGEIAGYVLADRVNDRRIIDIKDFFVKPEFRGRGVGGFILGRMFTLGNWDFPGSNVSIHHMPTAAKVGGIAIRLPGNHMTISCLDEDLGDHQINLWRFKNTIAKCSLSLMLEVHDRELNECVIYREGEAVADLLEDASNYGTDLPLQAIRALNNGIQI